MTTDGSAPAAVSPSRHRGGVRDGITFGISGLAAQADGSTAEDHHRALRTMVRAAALAEQHGLDAAWTSEHHFSSSGFMPAPLVALAAIGERTERISLGTDVMLPAMWDPVRLAEEAAVVDQLCGGRLILAMGIGYRDFEFEGLGSYRRDRVARFERAIDVIREASGGRVRDPGLLPVGSELPMSPTPLQPGGPLLWGGGKVEAAVRRARRCTEGYFASMMSPGALRRRVGWLDDEAPLGDFAVAQTSLVFVGGRDAVDVAALGLGRVQSYMLRWRDERDGTPGGLVLEDAPVEGAEWRPGQEWHAATPRPDLPDEERLTHAIVVGDPDTCIEALAPFVEALADAPGSGPRHLSARLTYPLIADADTDECIRLFACEVVPVLRHRFDERRRGRSEAEVLARLSSK
jgi:alkanesulfonate monooxygenase SsuD/methylene tetrahydromethanopterin reductase-like flavin-dependent oxidoreductase (luciferase family)